MVNDIPESVLVVEKHAKQKLPIEEEELTVSTATTKEVDDDASNSPSIKHTTYRTTTNSATATKATTKSVIKKNSSVTKTLTSLLQIPSNRVCADCRSALVDPSQVHASFCPRQRHDLKLPTDVSMSDFALTHQSFAPPRLQKETALKYGTDPALLVNQRFGGHGVFVCAACAKAHALLPSSIAVVRPVQMVEGENDDDKRIGWTENQIQYMMESGGNAGAWRVYEEYMPEAWKNRRPSPASTLSERHIFVRAKYEALAFCFPPPGPLSNNAWCNILDRHPEYGRFTTPDLKNYCQLSPSGGGSSTNTTHRKKKASLVARGPEEELPNRLVDYFAVVSCSLHILDRACKTHHVESLEDLAFIPNVSDCYPSQSSHSDTDFPSHLATFVLPDGCKACKQPLPPKFFTIVLTTGIGVRLYGAVLQIWDESVDVGSIRDAALDSGYTEEELPPCLSAYHESYDSEAVAFFPRCLVIISHHPMLDLFREILLQLYRITLVEAPLPIERYIANFASEVPLPPAGRIKVEFGFTSDKVWTIERPPLNELPLVNFSYRPLFATLSVCNIITVLGCLLEECRVVLLSKHYSLLCPVAEALVASLFPFTWQGLYIPVLPYSMTDCLEAPVPFLIGLHSRFLQETDPTKRPRGIVYVDLDRDVVRLGVDEDGQMQTLPSLPSRDALKLKASLEEYASSVYLIPDSGIEGCILTGDGLLIINEEREQYAQMKNVEVSVDSLGRTEVFSVTDKAYRDGDLSAAVTGFRTVHGHLEDDSDSQPPSLSKSRTGKSSLRQKQPLFLRGRRTPCIGDYDNARGQGHLLEVAEPSGFSVKEIRGAFLRFFVSIFRNYRSFLLPNDDDLFNEDEFVCDIHLNARNQIFLETFLQTQMFQRFLEERRDNPNLPEIRFFDESIIAKNNRSKKHTLAAGGKQATPFLDDESGKVTKTFTPPPPSNLGLPDDDKTFHYGSFPALNHDLFGRLRPPQLWPETGGSSLRLRIAPSVRKTQQEIVKKAMRPILRTPAAAMLAFARRSGNELESALAMMQGSRHSGRSNQDGAPSRQQPETANESQLSQSAPRTNLVVGSPMMHGTRHTGKKGRVFRHQSSVDKDGDDNSKLSHPGSTVNTLSRAETIILNARRKQGIVLGLIISIQSCWRGYVAMKRYRSSRRAVVQLQRRFIAAPHKQMVAVRVERKDRSLVLIQSGVRRCLARLKLGRTYDAVKLIQSKQRGQVARAKFLALRKAVILGQKITRRRRTQYMFNLTRYLVSLIQARFRGYQARTQMRLVMDRRQVVYNWQIFALWHLSHTSLAFRTKLWPTLSADWGFLHLRVAETELSRLWTLLGVPLQDDVLERKYWNDTALRLGDSMGVGSVNYRWCLHVGERIQENRSLESSNPLLKGGLESENAERLQVYERISSNTSESLATVYQDFDIPSNEPKKKLQFSNKIWTIYNHVGKSVSAMLVLFPELEGSLNIVFQTPSSKGMRRFPKAKTVTSPPVEQSLWDNTSLEGIVNKHMKEVATVMITEVPRLMAMMNEAERKKDVSFRSWRKAAMKTRQIGEWKACRHEMIYSFLTGRHDKSKQPMEKTEQRSSAVLAEAKSNKIATSTPTGTGTNEAHFPDVETVWSGRGNVPGIMMTCTNGGTNSSNVEFPDIELKQEEEYSTIPLDAQFPDIDIMTSRNCDTSSSKVKFPEIEMIQEEESGTIRLDAHFPDIDMTEDGTVEAGIMDFPQRLSI